ncbi:MAG: hypothetical protein GY930_01350 [bacterium]|nr:hypothetical protein [bacterium]
MKPSSIPMIFSLAFLWLVGSCKQPVPYQTKAPAMVTGALEQAQADGKWLLVDLGAPW